jgi:hypothetical protein
MEDGVVGPARRIRRGDATHASLSARRVPARLCGIWRPSAAPERGAAMAEGAVSGGPTTEYPRATCADAGHAWVAKKAIAWQLTDAAGVSIVPILYDVLACPCGGREAIVAILTHLGIPTEPPPIARARSQPFDAAWV